MTAPASALVFPFCKRKQNQHVSLGEPTSAPARANLTVVPIVAIAFLREVNAVYV